MKVFSRASEILSFGKSRTTPQLPNEKPNCNPVITLSGCVVEGTAGPSHTGHRHPTASCCQKLTAWNRSLLFVECACRVL